MLSVSLLAQNRNVHFARWCDRRCVDLYIDCLTKLQIEGEGVGLPNLTLPHNYTKRAALFLEWKSHEV